MVCDITPFERSLWVPGDPDFGPENDLFDEGYRECPWP